MVQAEAAFASKDYHRAASFFAKVNYPLLDLILSLYFSYKFCYFYLIPYERT